MSDWRENVSDPRMTYWPEGKLESATAIAAEESVMLVFTFVSAPTKPVDFNVGVRVREGGLHRRIGYKFDARSAPQPSVYDMRNHQNLVVAAPYAWDRNTLTITFPVSLWEGVTADAEVLAFLSTNERDLDIDLPVSIVA